MSNSPNMSSPTIECVPSTQPEFLLPATVATENGGTNGSAANTIAAVDTFDTPKSYSCKSSPAKHTAAPAISPPSTLTLKSSTSSLMADSSCCAADTLAEDADLPPEGDVKVASHPTTMDADAVITSKMNVAEDASTAAADLLKWKDMPRHLQFNRYIVEGYRPLTDAKGCVHSLFYFHNETVNILTHGIPVLYILATVPYLLPWDEFRVLSWCHLLGTLAPWCGSFVYHLFMNLDHGEVVYYRLLKLDMFGIWMSQSFGAITFVTATAFCWKIKWLLIGAYCILCLHGLYKALLAASPWQRRLCFLFPFVMRLHLVVLRMFKLAGGNTESMVHVYLQDGVSIIGGAIGAMNIPEKWLPGNVDFFLNSHNIMHVLVVVAVYSMHQATMRDLEWMSKSGCSGGLINGTIPLDTIGSSHHTEL